ncbi:MAG: hypothetical protein AMS27_01025 [Bacteroides sp. SM23_62_1]|nr:MAG: hypothetical protein AMS27_01025 [Bacteroides sp. SM23_62_1]
MKKVNLLIVMLSVLSSCMKDEPFKTAYRGFEPSVMNDGWEISNPENENMDGSILDQAYMLVHSDDRYLMARSLLVFRNNKLVAEAYPYDAADIDAIQNIQSCTKSITSIMTGIAVHEGKIDSLTEKLFSIYPEYFDQDIHKRTISIEDALTMRTGLGFDNGTHTLELYKTNSSSIAYVLSLESVYPSGMIMKYKDGDPQLVSKAIEMKTGKKLSDYANEKLFSPLGITEWKWESAKDGTTFGAVSLFLKPRDFGKIGQLLLQNGKWDNISIIDSTYLSLATSIKVTADFNEAQYGYYFWILPAFEGYAAEGHGGQFLLVVPPKKLVVVYTAWPYTSGDFFDQASELMSIIINSCN